ncbi:LysE family translocator [Planktomarina sp.]|jgi:threonine/homoserine/homoserine lactone efflux protein|nr:LysE family translocator [Planktomarina sp.]
MTYSLLTGLVLFCFVSSITPGPNNLMLMATGANFGARRAAPHASGIVLGFTFMIVAIGLGVAQLFQSYPLAHQVLGGVSVIYLIYLAYKTATARTNLVSPEPTGKPITFWQAAAFQWVNPKAWTMALAAVTVYAPQPVTYKEVIVVAVIFGAINLPCISVWLLLGVKMRRFLTTPARLRSFNWTMAGLLLLSLAPIAALN